MTEVAEGIRNQINLGNLFHQSRIVVADDYSKSVFVGSQINRIDLIFDGSGLSRIPPDHLDLVELTEAEFRHLSTQVGSCWIRASPFLREPHRDHERRRKARRVSP